MNSFRRRCSLMPGLRRAEHILLEIAALTIAASIFPLSIRRSLMRIALAPKPKLMFASMKYIQIVSVSREAAAIAGASADHPRRHKPRLSIWGQFGRGLFDGGPG